MATLIIDGQEVHAEEGQTLLEVARANGIEIPTLCYHPLLEPYGACRLCTVEVIRRGRSRLETSCTHPAWDGLVVKTRSSFLRSRS
jgi:NADH dehydrogenase/NADH:ubiquinone oxidoreductase subunit G